MRGIMHGCNQQIIPPPGRADDERDAETRRIPPLEATNALMASQAVASACVAGVVVASRLEASACVVTDWDGLRSVGLNGAPLLVCCVARHGPDRSDVGREGLARNDCSGPRAMRNEE